MSQGAVQKSQPLAEEQFLIASITVFYQRFIEHGKKEIAFVVGVIEIEAATVVMFPVDSTQPKGRRSWDRVCRSTIATSRESVAIPFEPGRRRHQ